MYLHLIHRDVFVNRFSWYNYCMKKNYFYRPVRPWNITQRFGENKACIKNDGSNTVIGCDGNNPPEGYRSLYGSNGHGGIDLAGQPGQPIFASRNGIVATLDTNKKSGLDVRITSIVAGQKFLHIYEHLDKILVSVGQRVHTGQLIGFCGATGLASGPHLHFEIRNATGHSLNPEKYLDEVYADDVLKIHKQIMAARNSLYILAEKIIRLIKKQR